MIEKQTFPMTVEGEAQLQKELEKLTQQKRPEVVERIKIARGYGDLSENSEYSSAKEEQSIIESRIKTIENMLDNVELIDDNKIDKDEVSIGRIVKFKELPDESPEEYEIVGSAEADPLNGKMSNDSPIAKCLIGKKVGEEVEVDIPTGTINVKILEVRKLK